MFVTKRGGILVFVTAVGALLSTASAFPAYAASAVTKRFLANVVPNVDFLDRSSRFALTNSKSRRLKAFAFATAREQTLAANALYDWTIADSNPQIPLATSKALDTAPTGSAATTQAQSHTQIQAPSPTSWQAMAMAASANHDEPLPLGQEDLDSLEGLDGAAFDAQYKEKQADALAQLEADYKSYAADGDDAALKALAAHELAKISRRRAALGKL